LGVSINPNPKLVYEDLSSSSTVNSGASETVTVTPPAGKICRLIGIRLNADPPPASSSGTHEFELNYNTTGTYFAFFSLKAPFNGYPVANKLILSGATSELPSGDPAQVNMFGGGIFFSSDYPLKIDYNNDTDTNQTNDRTIKVYYLQWTEGG
jgi:hypothetical protein